MWPRGLLVLWLRQRWPVSVSEEVLADLNVSLHIIFVLWNIQILQHEVLFEPCCIQGSYFKALESDLIEFLLGGDA